MIGGITKQKRGRRVVELFRFSAN